MIKISTISTSKNQNSSIYIYIYYTIIFPVWSTDGRYFYHISGTTLFSGTNYYFLLGNSDIFITFRVHQVLLQIVPLNGNEKSGGFRGAQRVEKVY